MFLTICNFTSPVNQCYPNRDLSNFETFCNAKRLQWHFFKKGTFRNNFKRKRAYLFMHVVSCCKTNGTRLKGNVRSQFRSTFSQECTKHARKSRILPAHHTTNVCRFRACMKGTVHTVHRLLHALKHNQIVQVSVHRSSIHTCLCVWGESREQDNTHGREWCTTTVVLLVSNWVHLKGHLSFQQEKATAGQTYPPSFCFCHKHLMARVW